MEKNATGDCFEASLSLFILMGHSQVDVSHLRLVHAEVEGNGGEAKGIRYAHSFLLIDDHRVIDPSNGRMCVMSKKKYYDAGKISEIGNLVEYTFEEALEQMQKHEHYGPWDLVTSTGL